MGHTRSHPSWRRASILGALVAVFASWSCTEEVIQFRDRELFNPPADAAAGFLGYFRQSDKLTSCGNCHIESQREWQTTRHADAWATLMGSGSAQGFCEGCHTVSELGNTLESAAGYNAVKDSSYHDVQCESCHGPGLTHVQGPGTSQPIPSLTIASDPAINCAECHQGAHHPFVEEWEQSAHAKMVPYVQNRDPARSGSCLPCHSAQGVLKAWGVNATYLEQDDPQPQQLGIVCAVCHDPHGSPNTAQLRFPIDVPDQEENLCMKCHHKRAAPEVDSEIIRGPHSPEGPLLLGEEAGWFPPGFNVDSGIGRIAGTHGSEANPRMCATCHVAKFTVTDPATGNFRFNATGHLFVPIPCVDSTGVPTASTNCTLTQRDFQACTAAGCHGSQTAARSAYTLATTRIDRLVQEVDSLLTLVPPAENRRNDGRFTVADGAWFNARLGALPGTPIHNPFLAEYLLLASVDVLKTTYGLTPPVTGVSLERMLR